MLQGLDQLFSGLGYRCASGNSFICGDYAIFPSSQSNLRVFSYNFWSSLILLTGSLVIFFSFAFGHPRIRGAVVCPAKAPAFTVAAMWAILVR